MRDSAVIAHEDAARLSWSMAISGAYHSIVDAWWWKESDDWGPDRRLGDVCGQNTPTISLALKIRGFDRNPHLAARHP